METKMISLVVDEKEYADFLRIKEVWERNSEADTIRAMISFCKKNLPKTVAIATKKGE